MIYIPYGQNKIAEEERQQNNKKYIEEELKKNQQYFNKMFEKIDPCIKLDHQQQRIIVTDEDYVMVIAGAGSGKTTTITAKVDYLIKKKHIKPKEIVIITFTNKAVEELKDRIINEFKHEIKITTFHKFGYEIIKSINKYKPKINNAKDEIIGKIVKKELKIKDKDNYKTIKYFIKKKNIIKIIKLKKNYEIDEQTYEKIIQICINVISLLKSKNYSEEKLDTIKFNNRIIIQFLKKIYIQYEETLKKQNKIDFDDMINNATEIIEQGKNINMRYKYIIIDEYQDISESRYNLIKKIAEKQKSKIIVVGDDWQCIYSFAASNINLFTNFTNKVPYCEVLKIENTYRNSQQLINIAGKFIQKNKKQIRKNLKSNKFLDNPVKIIKYKKEFERKLIDSLDYIIEKYGEEKNILIIGRYNFDKKEIIKSMAFEEKNGKVKYKKNKKVKIDFMTIHSSKGLGYDNVILINAKRGKFGFPSNKKNNRIIDQLVNHETKIKYAEERRLFYVALTRTKNEIIILTPKKKQSCFIKEIRKYKNVTIKSNIIKK